MGETAEKLIDKVVGEAESDDDLGYWTLDMDLGLGADSLAHAKKIVASVHKIVRKENSPSSGFDPEVTAKAQEYDGNGKKKGGKVSIQL